MSHYGNYIKERLGKDIVENEKGFATYKIFGQVCYIEDIYVAPDYRRERFGTELADMIAALAKAKGCTTLIGSVFPPANGSTESMQALLYYGFKLSEVGADGLIYLRKEI